MMLCHYTAAEFVRFSPMPSQYMFPGLDEIPGNILTGNQLKYAGRLVLIIEPEP